MKNFRLHYISIILYLREQEFVVVTSLRKKENGTYKYILLVECSLSLHHVKTDKIFREVYLCTVLKYDVSVMKSGITDL